MPRADREERLAYHREYSRAYRQREKAKVRTTQISQWAKYRSAALVALGERCIECGNDDPRVLDIDHSDGSGGDDRRKRSKVSILRSVVTNPGAYQLLCANCHRIKTYENGEHLRRAVVADILTG